MLMAKDKSEKQDKLFEDQFDNEEVLYVFRKHPIVMRKGLVIGMVAWLIGPLYVLVLTLIYPPDSSKYPSVNLFFISLIVSILLGVILFAPSWISWFYSIFIVTDQRLIQITQKGLFHKTVVDLGLNQIQMVNYEIAGFQEAVLGFGTIMMQTYMGDLVIHDVHHPAHTQKKIIGILREQGVDAGGSPVKQGKASQNTDEETN
jgi:hypothetical protein